MLTIFTIPKSFIDPHIDIIQTNAIKSWQCLNSECEIILIGGDLSVREKAVELGVKYIPVVKCNEFGTPLLDSAFELARNNTSNKILAYLNTDIILLSNFSGVFKYLENLSDFLAVGRRYTCEITNRIIFNNNWEMEVKELVRNRGYLDAKNALDYFIYKKGSFRNIPPFAVGRVGWDNWMIYEARRKKMLVVDLTEAVTVIHQKHNYGHQADKGRDRDGNPEALRNLKLAGGSKHIFNLDDTNWLLTGNGLEKRKFSIQTFVRYLSETPEILPGRVFQWFIHFIYGSIGKKIIKFIIPKSFLNYVRNLRIN